jgi:ribosomal protein L30/L7E
MEYGRSLGEELLICTGAAIRQKHGLRGVMLESTWNEISPDMEQLLKRLRIKYLNQVVEKPNSYVWMGMPEPIIPFIAPSS